MTINLWVNGQEYVAHCDKTIDVENPATGKVVDQLALADKHCLDQVVDIAHQAQKEWARTALAKRVDIMFKFRQLVIEHQDEIADAIVREGGKTHGDALGEIARGRETVDFACGINAALKGEFTDQASTGVDVHTLRQPVGVVAGICPFNFPAMVPMWMHPVALATGNAFILKVASTVPSASLIIARLYKEAGLPDGLFNVIAGDRHLVTDILTHPGIDAISFVGSTPVAHIVQNTGVTHGKRVQALGGANNHAIVMPDADIEFAAQHISAGAFGAAGQRCMALPVIVAVGGVEEKLVPAIKARAEKIVVGPGTDPASEMGPVITRSSQERITTWIDEAEAKGANVVLDGRGYRPKVGVARLALESRVPVVPIGQIGTDLIQPSGSNRIHLRHDGEPIRVRTVIGKPLTFEKYTADVEISYRSQREVADTIGAAIRALSGQEYVDVYADRVKKLMADEHLSADEAVSRLQNEKR